MTEAQLIKIFKEQVYRYELRHWRFELRLGVCAEDMDDDDSDDVIAACITCHTHYQEAIVQVREGWEKWDEEYARRCLAHELGHAAVHDLTAVLKEVAEYMPPGIRDVYETKLHHEEERFVQQLAVMMVEAQEETASGSAANVRVVGFKD